MGLRPRLSDAAALAAGSGGGDGGRRSLLHDSKPADGRTLVVSEAFQTAIEAELFPVDSYDLYLDSQGILSDDVTGLIHERPRISAVRQLPKLYYFRRALGVTNLGFLWAVYELRSALSFCRRCSSSASAQTIQWFPEVVFRE